MKKASGWMTGFAVVMLAYTGWRTYDYMGSSLEGVEAWTKFVVAIAFLAFSELGLILWLHKALPGATTNTQEVSAQVMVWVDFAGSMVMGLADLLKHNTIYTVDLQWLDPLLFLAPWIMVVANVGAYLIYHMADSDRLLDQAERELSHEENQLEIQARRGAIRELRMNKTALAKDLSPHYYGDVRDRVTGRTLGRFKAQAQLPPTPPQVFYNLDSDKVTQRLNGATGKNGKADQTENHPNA